MHDVSRPLPRRMSPRLPIGRRWLRFCRSSFARDLGASVCGLRTTIAVISAVVTFYVGLNVAAAVFVSLGGAL